MTGELAVAGVAGRHLGQPCAGRRQRHGTGNVQQHVEVDVGRQGIGRLRSSSNGQRIQPQDLRKDIVGCGFVTDRGTAATRVIRRRIDPDVRNTDVARRNERLGLGVEDLAGIGHGIAVRHVHRDLADRRQRRRIRDRVHPGLRLHRTRIIDPHSDREDQYGQRHGEHHHHRTTAVSQRVARGSEKCGDHDFQQSKQVIWSVLRGTIHKVSLSVIAPTPPKVATGR